MFENPRGSGLLRCAAGGRARFFFREDLLFNETRHSEKRNVYSHTVRLLLPERSAEGQSVQMMATAEIQREREGEERTGGGEGTSWGKNKRSV